MKKIWAPNQATLQAHRCVVSRSPNPARGSQGLQCRSATLRSTPRSPRHCSSPRCAPHGPSRCIYTTELSPPKCSPRGHFEGHGHPSPPKCPSGEHFWADSPPAALAASDASAARPHGHLAHATRAGAGRPVSAARPHGHLAHASRANAALEPSQDRFAVSARRACGRLAQSTGASAGRAALAAPVRAHTAHGARGLASRARGAAQRAAVSCVVRLHWDLFGCVNSSIGSGSEIGLGGAR